MKTIVANNRLQMRNLFLGKWQDVEQIHEPAGLWNLERL